MEYIFHHSVRFDKHKNDIIYYSKTPFEIMQPTKDVIQVIGRVYEGKNVNEKINESYPVN